MYVPEAPFVLHLPNVMHLATDVTGVLPRPERRAPARRCSTSRSPAPLGRGVRHPDRRRRPRLIDELEQMDRDRYAGRSGWVDARGDGESGIALRSARLDPANRSGCRLFAGCGIVAGSDPEAELAESDAKLVPMRDALG